MNTQRPFTITPAQRHHTPAIHAMIAELAQYEKLEHLLKGTVRDLEKELFGERPIIEAVTALVDETPVAFALYFHNYSIYPATASIASTVPAWVIAVAGVDRRRKARTILAFK